MVSLNVSKMFIFDSYVLGQQLQLISPSGISNFSFIRVFVVPRLSEFYYMSNIISVRLCNLTMSLISSPWNVFVCTFMNIRHPVNSEE